MILRAFRAEDLGTLVAIWSDPEVVRHLGGQPLSREDTWRRAVAACGQWPYVGFGYWVAELKETSAVIGQLGFADFKRAMDPNIEGQPELGYVFSAAVHGQGIAYEACKAALNWADANLKAKAYPAIISRDNSASIRLAERLGFKRLPDATYKGEPIALFSRDVD